jgi:hypothetical protein
MPQSQMGEIKLSRAGDKTTGASGREGVGLPGFHAEHARRSSQSLDLPYVAIQLAKEQED